MPLKILCAGCSKDERAAVEAGVRTVLADRGRSEPWTVSVVKFGSGWSVTLDGPLPGGRGRNFMLTGPAGAEAVADAVRSALDPTAPHPAPLAARPGGPVAAEPAGRRDDHTCSVCGRRFVLVYEAAPDEPLEDAPVACPHCWQVGRVQVARSASIGRDYRADKL
jgi:DNA-directed RNA polymerase subunit RPC12/RpoP